MQQEQPTPNPCVLFSCISGKDPIGNNRDGPFIHILRNYRPEFVKIFLSSEMKGNNKEDKIKEACHRISFKPELNFQDLGVDTRLEPNKFESLDDIFKKAIIALHEKYPNHTLLINLSSGTPQMQASLYLLCAILPFPVCAIQVNNPLKSANPEKSPLLDFDLWEKEEAAAKHENRCSEVKLEKVNYAITKSNVHELILQYDYSGALKVANETLDPKVPKLLKLAEHRISQNVKDSDLHGLCATEYFEILPDSSAAGANAIYFTVYEYILWMDILLKREEYSNFARAISPVLTDLFSLCCKQAYNIDPNDFCLLNEDNIRCIKKSKISSSMLINDEEKAALKQAFPSKKNDPDISFKSSSILKIINVLKEKKPSQANDWVLKANLLRNFERNVRNLAAHELSTIDAEKIKVAAKMEPQSVMENMKALFVFCYPIKSTLNWDGYKRLNDSINQLLN